jgi:FMN reductase
VVVDLAELGTSLISWGHPEVAAVIQEVCSCDVAVIASPTFKGTYTGLLKLFLDQFSAGSLADMTCFPLMLGAGPGHALAPEVFLRPVLVELGASCPVRGLYLLESSHADQSTWAEWLSGARRHLTTGRFPVG